ncbi:hypothetical protein SKAU_G00425630 [Synaphobranchus kaupii]|uniref:Uncharacterized protein n=1 Tax=Synaphobranchus kaupii TaxID=118154 RepID=A0A9Q1E573_SYNKA|nr:hypothetical protein SKAU_G00425630 [Synaphobranchus kaupii]
MSLPLHVPHRGGDLQRPQTDQRRPALCLPPPTPPRSISMTTSSPPCPMGCWMGWLTCAQSRCTATPGCATVLCFTYAAGSSSRRRTPLYHNVTCSSPPHMQGRLLMYLVEEEVLDSCQYWYCNLALASQIMLFLLIGVQAILLGFLVYFLRRYEKLSREAQRTVEESFTGGDAENEYVMLTDRSA